MVFKIKSKTLCCHTISILQSISEILLVIKKVKERKFKLKEYMKNMLSLPYNNIFDTSNNPSLIYKNFVMNLE